MSAEQVQKQMEEAVSAFASAARRELVPAMAEFRRAAVAADRQARERMRRVAIRSGWLEERR